MERVELSSSVWKTEVLPLNDIRTVGKQGLEPRPPAPKAGALTLTPHPAEVEMAGIEPAAATLARRARYLSCHPHGQASARGFGLPFHGAHTMDVSIVKPVRGACRDNRSRTCI